MENELGIILAAVVGLLLIVMIGVIIAIWLDSTHTMACIEAGNEWINGSCVKRRP